MFIETKNLPAIVRQALASLRYGKRDIEVQTVPSVAMPGAYGDGYRGYVCLVDLTPGNERYETHLGSWGGSNMFVRTAVDDDQNSYPLPTNGIAVIGQQGNGTTARICIPKEMEGNILPAAPTLSADALNALYCYVCIRSGQYRKDALARYNVQQSSIDDLVVANLLKRARNGAITVTTAGKNALGKYAPRG